VCYQIEKDAEDIAIDVHVFGYRLIEFGDACMKNNAVMLEQRPDEISRSTGLDR
jgi:hypothetical protein